MDAARNVDPTPVVHEFVVHLKPPDTTFVDPPPLVTCGPHARFKVPNLSISPSPESAAH